MNNLNKQLYTLGFNKKEARTYIALLELGHSTLAELARKAKVKRTTLYDVVRGLKGRGLISTIRSGGRLLYVAEDPRTIQNRMEEQLSALSATLPELLSIANVLPKKPKVRYYEGIEGIKEIYRDILRYPDQKMYSWVSDSMINNFDHKFITEHYIPKRLEKKIWAEVIAPETMTGKQFQGKDATALRATKLLDAQKFPLSIEVSLYGHESIGFMSIEDEVGVIVESKPIADTLKSIFRQQWESLSLKKDDGDL